MTVAALVLGAGSGERFRASLPAAVPGGSAAAGEESGLAKAFVRLRGRTLLDRSVSVLCACDAVGIVVPVIGAGEADAFRALLPELRSLAKLGAPVVGGRLRQDSVRAGLEVLPRTVRTVVVHDAARPLVTPEAVARVVRAGQAQGAAILALPVPDTIQRVRGGWVVETPPRNECFAAQTPQVFRIDWLREALAKAQADGTTGSDDAELVARLGVAVQVVEGEPFNLKITTLLDLRVAEALLGAHEEAGR